MRKDAVALEEYRLSDVSDLESFPWVRDRHRIFPAIFEKRRHKKILDTSAGVGYVARNIQLNYPAEITCNDLSPTALKILNELGLPTVSFNIDDPSSPFPFEDGNFDAVLSLATVEHLVYPDHFIRETNRVLRDGGYLYISSPNYASLFYLLKLALDGRTFHDPLSPNKQTRYEFYAHIRPFTFKTLVQFVSSFGYTLDTVYLALPQQSSLYQEVRAKSKARGLLYRYGRWLMYRLLPPRWAAEPIFCFRKGQLGRKSGKVRKVVL